MINKKIFIYIFLGLFITFTVLIAGFFIKIYQGGLKVNSVTDILQNRLGKKHNINFEELFEPLEEVDDATTKKEKKEKK